MYLNLKNGVLTSFRGWNKICSDVHPCLFHAITSKEEMIGSRAAWTVATAICHDTLKSHKTVFIVWISYKMTKADTLFHTKSNLLCLVCRCVVSLLIALRCIFHCVRTWCVVWEWHGLSDIATVDKGAEPNSALTEQMNQFTDIRWISHDFSYVY